MSFPSSWPRKMTDILTHCGLATLYGNIYITGSTLAHIMACCLMAPSRYLNQCWLIIRKAPACPTFPGKPCRQVTGDNFCYPQFPPESMHLSHGSRPDLPASVHTSPICPQTSVKHAQNFVQVSCGYQHAGVIAKHQQEARKGHNLLVYNLLKA